MSMSIFIAGDQTVTRGARDPNLQIAITIAVNTLTLTVLIPVEQILKSFRSCFKVLEYGVHY